MKQIEFTLDAFTPDGMLKEGYKIMREYGKIIFCIKVGEYITLVDGDGLSDRISVGEFSLRYKLYRRTRTAFDVASQLSFFNELTPIQKSFVVEAVQAGMDEMKND